MSGGAPITPAQSALLPPASATFIGTLIQHGQVRSMDIDGQGHMVPVLILTLQTDAPGHNHLQSQQPFPADRRDQCEAAARRYRKGMRVSVQAPVASLRMYAGNTLHVHVLSPTDQETA
jgi:hypothetical protein